MEQVTSDVLGMMMIARDPESGQGMSDNELRDQVMTLMLAGHEVSVFREALCFTADVFFKFFSATRSPSSLGRLPRNFAT